jgi:ribonuclease HI
MELTAAAEAVRATPGSLTVHSDSKYVVDCFNARPPWWQGWVSKGRLSAASRKPVANRELWEPLIAEVRRRRGAGNEVAFVWVKGHSGDRMNNAADRLASEAANTQTGRSGDCYTDAIIVGL